MARLLVLPLLVASVACGGELVVEDERAPIIGGMSAAGRDPSVGLLMGRVPGGRTFCTATMITPRVVLTAAHCVDITTSDEIWFADSYDHATNEFTGLIDATRRVAVAKWWHPLYDEGTLSGGFDIALLALDIPAPEAVVPSRIRRHRLGVDAIGAEVRMVGFGLRVPGSESSLHAKYHGRDTVTAVTDRSFRNSGERSTICFGDSGGPAFMMDGGREVQTGVTSFTTFSCNLGGSFTTVDAHLADIRAFIAENDPQPPGACVADGTCDVWCDAPDPDCPCAGEGVCSTACDDPAIDPDCPPDCSGGNNCVREGCAVPDPDCGDAPLGVVCTRDDDCASRRCHPTRRICAETCGAGGACPAMFTCATGNLCEAISEGGCGCRAAPGSNGWWGGLLAAAIALLWRRRATA
jgi:MYXO-CTERM domain-containing protein